MEKLQDDRMLEFRSDTLEAVRRDVNLHMPGRMDEAIDILEKWVQMQPHFVKKDFSRDYLERTLITAKGLVERAKERLDKLCTFRTLMPEFFAVSDVKKEFSPLQSMVSTAHLPKLTPEHYRVYMFKMVSDVDFSSSIVFKLYRYLTMLCEYFKRVEYCSGFVIILDYSDANILNVVTKMSPIELRQMITLMTEGYGLRIKGIHVVTESKMIDAVLSLLKQVFSTKLVNRIYSHKTIEGVKELVPKSILPIDYGGKEKSLKELNNDWLEAISSKDFLEYYTMMNRAKTNESCRQADQFNENYLGMPGSFRALSVD
ncbi:uncharacterized protein LOC142981899 [Anticarsia gemmatalis]|uniref:uncharacterized protein LOC142981899 n=1 Tax=Anticarsia gemmatalis TaxID=129554 RepID=UPI003F766F5E